MNSAKLKQIESSSFQSKSAMLTELKQMNKVNIKINIGKEIGDIESINYNSPHSSSRRRVSKNQIKNEIQEHIAIQDANKMLAVQATKYNKKLRDKINKRIEK